MTTAIAPVAADPDTAVAKWRANAELVETVKQAVFPDANDGELALFFHDCQRQNCHPLDRLIHPTVYVDQKTGKRRYVAVTSIDLMRSRAADSGGYAGSDEPEFGPEVQDKDGYGKDYKRPEWCRVTIHRLVQGQRSAFTHKAWWTEYYPGDGRGQMWRKMPHNQLAKCTEAAALRKAFPRELERAYVEGESSEYEAPPDVDIRRPAQHGRSEAREIIEGAGEAPLPEECPSLDEETDEVSAARYHDDLMKAARRVAQLTSGVTFKESPKGSGKLYIVYKPILPGPNGIKISDNGALCLDSAGFRELALKMEAEAERLEPTR